MKQTQEHINKRMVGASKSWFKKGVYIGEGFKKGHKPWNKGKKGWNTGHLVLDDTRDKIRNKLTRNKISSICINCGKDFKMVPSLRNKKKYCSRSCRDEDYQIRLIGSKNPSWLGGKSFEPYGLEFNNKLKEQIRTRDNNRCQQCFREEDELFTKSRIGKIVHQKLHVHHIDFNKQNNNQNNLISLCPSCHSQTQFNQGDWIRYFQKRISIG